MRSQPLHTPNERVSRRRYERERAARVQAEHLLEDRARALFEANEALKEQSRTLERTVQERTAELETAMRAAEAANAAKSAFLAMISHEIRTPLNGVLGMATGLCDSDLDDEQKRMADVILSSGQNLLSLLNDLLDLSKIEAQRVELEDISFNPRDMLAAIHALYSPIAEEKALELHCHLDIPVEFWIGDPTRLRQVVTNLMSNAIKFTSKGGVTLSAAMDGPTLTVGVSDTGPGVPIDKQDKLFEPFSQTDSSVNREFGGTGLGLSIARNLCQLMGGDLCYEDAPGGGACFVATANLQARKQRKAARAETGQSKGAAVLHARRWRVIAAEDGATNRKVLELLLRPFDIDLELVGNGQDAVSRHLAQPADLILMDINMPVMTGLEAAQAIRQAEAEGQFPGVPIIALTANAMKHEVGGYYKKGMTGYVSKPIQRDELANAMAAALQDLD